MKLRKYFLRYWVLMGSFLTPLLLMFSVAFASTYSYEHWGMAYAIPVGVVSMAMAFPLMMWVMDKFDELGEGL